MLQVETTQAKSAVLKIVGVGGAGCNAVNHMVETGIKGVEFISVNTDKQALNKCLPENKIQIGEKLTRGLGAGSNPEIGQRAAEETIEEIAGTLEGADMVFITAGIGGGTGTGAAPVIAKVAKEMGILTIGVVTRPFEFEGDRKKKQAELGIRFLKDYVDSLIVVPNQKLIEVSTRNTSFLEALHMSDDVLRQGVQGVSDIVSGYGMLNVDFADVKAAMMDRGIAHIGIGIGEGEDRASQAVKNAVESPLLETSIKGAKAVILYVSGGYDLGMAEVHDIAEQIKELVDTNVMFKFGAAIDENMQDKVQVTLIATGFDEGLDGFDEKIERPAEVKEAPIQDLTTEVDGVEGREVELQDLLKEVEDEEGESRFEIPSFL